MSAITSQCGAISIQGIGKQCKDNIGGIKRVFIIPTDELQSIGLNTSRTMVNNIVTVTPAEGTGNAKFRQYNFLKATGGMTSTATINENGTIYYTTVLSLQFIKMEADKQIEINNLVRGDFRVMVEDMRGNYWYLGYDNPVTATAATAAAGTAYEDLNGYTLELSDVSKDMPYQIDLTTVDISKIAEENPGADPLPTVG